ncbi:hypothetical protein [Bacillus alkalicellulosilyticus]|uniref:hypothetical protein n=1 Tax=Alkalihalobacterium alkalicellulosilyticum TaxID=1912214 RepID=UPI001FE6C6ED|nr:hypothetical protein [Bacillus alkalicellulosilyticus]
MHTGGHLSNAVINFWADDVITLLDKEASIGNKALAAGFILVRPAKFVDKALDLNKAKRLDNSSGPSSSQTPEPKTQLTDKRSTDVNNTQTSEIKGMDEIGWSMSKGGVINGRKYSQHALERMAPNTPEVKAILTSRAIKKAEELGFKPQTKEISDFIKKYVDPRNIPPSVIEDAIMNTKKIPDNRSGTFVHVTKDIKVIINEADDVITVIPN